jgi:hypothetical protein
MNFPVKSAGRGHCCDSCWTETGEPRESRNACTLPRAGPESQPAALLYETQPSYSRAVCGRAADAAAMEQRPPGLYGMRLRKQFTALKPLCARRKYLCSSRCFGVSTHLESHFSRSVAMLEGAASVFGFGGGGWRIWIIGNLPPRS